MSGRGHIDFDSRIVRLDGDLYVLSRFGEYRRGPAERVLLAHRIGDPEVVAALRALARGAAEVEFALHSGAIAVTCLPRRDVAIDPEVAGIELSDLAPAEDIATTPLTFIAFTVVDQDGEPWDDRFYALTLPDGRVRAGRLGAHEVMFDGLREGVGTLELRTDPLPDAALPSTTEVDPPDVELPPGRVPGFADDDPPDDDAPPVAGASTYEVRLLDAADGPIPGVPILLEAAGGSTIVSTGDDGVARLTDVAPGTAAARLADAEALAAALAGRSTGVRGPLESSEGRVVVTASGLLGGVSAQSDVPLDIVLLTELDLFFTPGMRGEPALEATSDLFALTAGPLSVLRMHASGDGSHAVVPEPDVATLEPPPPADPPPPGPTLWSPPNLYHVQAGDYLVKIAATYLGDGARWPEIWALNQHRFPGRSPDELFVGDTLVMPAEAVPPFVVPTVPPQQGPSVPPSPPGPWMNVDVEDIADALARQDFGVVFDFLSSIPSQPPPIPPPDPAFSFGAEEALFMANITALALQGELDHPPGDEPQP